MYICKSRELTTAQPFQNARELTPWISEYFLLNEANGEVSFRVLPR